jgi:hypothetical protein
MFFAFLGERSSKRVRLAVMDMWKPFRKSTNKKAPQARLIPLTQVNLYVVGPARGPACAFARIVSLDDVPIAGGFVVGGEPEQRFE